MADTKTGNESNDVISQILTTSEIPEVYANGFQVAAGTADVVIILQRNGKNIETINVSFTLAKTLALGLSEVIQIVEKNTDMDIKTTKDIQLGLEGNKDGN